MKRKIFSCIQPYQEDNGDLNFKQYYVFATDRDNALGELQRVLDLDDTGENAGEYTISQIMLDGVNEEGRRDFFPVLMPEDRDARIVSKIYPRWRNAMGGDDPKFDNDFDSFLNWLDEEVAMCEEN